MPFSQGLTRPQGDPGFFSFLGKVAKGIAGTAIGLVTGGIPQQIGRGVQQVLQPSRPPMGTMRRTFIPPAIQPTPFQLGIPRGACPPGMACPKGMRLNKSDYFLTPGTFVAAGTRCVSIRRSNPANVRALRRAIRREEGFIRLAKRTGLVALPKARRVRKAARK